MTANVMTRRQAAESGLTKYSTGRPCRNGHTVDRYTVSGACTACTRGYHAAYAQRTNTAAIARARGFEGITVVVHPDDAEQIRRMAAALMQARLI